MSRRGLVLALIAAVLVSLGTGTASPSTAASGGLVPYFPPPFAGTCQVHHYDEGVAPDVATLKDDPLCVDYAKRDITLDNGGAIRFALAEPARFAVAAGKCAYWQTDHWSVQVSTGQIPLIRWDGSYWFDLGTGRAGARLTGLTVAGQPATLAQAAAFIAPYSPALAAYFLTYANAGDGGAVNLGFPLNPFCAA